MRLAALLVVQNSFGFDILLLCIQWTKCFNTTWKLLIMLFSSSARKIWKNETNEAERVCFYPVVVWVSSCYYFAPSFSIFDEKGCFIVYNMMAKNVFMCVYRALNFHSIQVCFVFLWSRMILVDSWNYKVTWPMVLYYIFMCLLKS